MTDRNDASQRLTDQTNDNDESFYGDTSMNNHQIQAHPSATFATEEEMLGYHNNGSQLDPYSEAPSRFLNKPRAVSTVAVARQLPRASGPVVTAPALVSGWSVRETSGVTPAVIRFRDGLDIGNAIVTTISLAPGESARDFLTLPIETTRAVFMEIVSGTVEGQLYTVETRLV